MMWYFYLNYRIYKFYQQKNESIPGFYSFAATVVLVSFNIFSSVGVLGFIFDAVYNLIVSITKYSVIALYIIIASINYIILYKEGYYKQMFLFFEKNEEKYERWRKSILVYIISTIVFTLIVLAIADFRHNAAN
ncbi:MAG: hypothetical protein WBG62_17910 [Cyclobacteriaceae bacterium]